MPVGSGDQVLGYQEKSREDQGVDNRRCDYASGETAGRIVKTGAEDIAKSRSDEE